MFDGTQQQLAPLKTFIGPKAAADWAADQLRTSMRVAVARLLVIERNGTPKEKGAPVPRAAGLCAAAVAAWGVDRRAAVPHASTALIFRTAASQPLP